MNRMVKVSLYVIKYIPQNSGYNEAENENGYADCSENYDGICENNPTFYSGTYNDPNKV